MKITFLGISLVLFTIKTAYGAFGGHDKYNERMLLSEVSALTLYNGKMTNARRSAAVPQLKCVGGTAGCNAFVPQVVQCYNRGGDGYDVQWECKTDMDNAYRFGKVEVTCEGFDHPDDPYILRGSCGLEYTLDLTMEGHMHKQQKNHDYYGSHKDDSYHHRSDHHNGNFGQRASSIFSDLIVLCIIGIIVYAIYKTCIADRPHRSDDSSFRSHDRGSRPPPAGFRSDYMPPGGDSCSSSYTGNTYSSNQGTQQPGGFWTGAFTGGILGYLMGNRNNYGSHTYASPYSQPYTTYRRPSPGWGNWFGGGSGFMSRGSGGGFMSGGGSSSSSGTRTASGFGGTRRR